MHLLLLLLLLLLHTPLSQRYSSRAMSLDPFNILFYLVLFSSSGAQNLAISQSQPTKNQTTKQMNIDKLFLEPTVTQQGNHMVMTGVCKPTHKRSVNIDTRFAEASTPTVSANTCAYDIALPDRINGVKSITVESVELTHSWLNFSAFAGNTAFLVSTDPSFDNYAYVCIPDGQYSTPNSLVAAINSALLTATSYGASKTLAAAALAAAQLLTFAATTIDAYSSTSASKCSIHFASSSSSSSSTWIRFVPFAASWSSAASNVAGFASDKVSVRQFLGWKLGYRNAHYLVGNAGSSLAAEAPMDIGGPKYVFLTLDPFAQSAASSTGIIAQYNASLAAKNILAKLPVLLSSFGQALLVIPTSGLVAPTVYFPAPAGIQMQRMRVQLSDEFGRPIDTQNVGFSFTCSIDIEQ